MKHRELFIYAATADAILYAESCELFRSRRRVLQDERTDLRFEEVAEGRTEEPSWAPSPVAPDVCHRGWGANDLELAVWVMCNLGFTNHDRQDDAQGPRRPAWIRTPRQQKHPPYLVSRDQAKGFIWRIYDPGTWLRASYVFWKEEYLPLDWSRYVPSSRIEWMGCAVVQASSINYRLHLLIVSMNYLLKKYGIEAQNLIPVPTSCATSSRGQLPRLALQIGKQPLDIDILLLQGVAFLSAVDVETQDITSRRRRLLGRTAVPAILSTKTYELSIPNIIPQNAPELGARALQHQHGVGVVNPKFLDNEQDEWAAIDQVQVISEIYIPPDEIWGHMH
ncbi:hypothetical protein PLICRDRAFT_33193 [Plicaturopsis crispa FD-325 SS-3]|uniref:Uncharacterized protein n=1 Tax=Plicaturopsis crispa FD-325 SS-3 TaxID=944288 RepID=A0A0C9SV75_PLICR|nr:hypothetical protein PLICRDRAFT_33193 [Plicaturopsis crispa FD-325 SS-3]